MKARLCSVSLAVVLVVCCVSAAFAQPVSPLPRQAVADPAALYDSLRLLDRAEVKRLYAMFPAEDRQEIWTAHLIAFLNDHPELTAEQQDVVLQGLGIVNAGIFRVDRSSPEWETRFNAPVARLMQRARDLMSAELVSEAFVRLDKPARDTKPGPRVTTHAPECDCSTQLSHCEDNVPSQYCRPRTPGLCTMVVSYNCGPFFVYACDGMCTSF